MKELKLCLPKAERERVTKQMEQITNTRNRRINHYLHAASKRMIDLLVGQGIGTVIVGKNPSGSKRLAWASAITRTSWLFLMHALLTC
jgi:hypothetical protein